MFPAGVTHYIIGGAFIGLGIMLIYLVTGIQAGASGFFSAALHRLTGHKEYKASLDWRIIFTVATITGAFLYAVIFNDFFTTSVSTWRLAVAGVLVGMGARMAKGCTSGHGLCGTGASNKSSFLFIILIILVAALTAVIL